MADIRAAEREATSGAYNGAKAVATHIGNSVGLKWAVELQDALKELGDGSDAGLIVVVGPHTSLNVDFDHGSHRKWTQQQRPL